jgi:hypothetical protein
MTKHGRWLRGAGLTLVSGIACSLGCQTYLGGMTLPSPDYLKDRPDYIQRAPQFGLPRELNSMQAASRNSGVTTTAPIPGGPSVNVPAPPTGVVPPAPGAAAPPAPGIN